MGKHHVFNVCHLNKLCQRGQFNEALDIVCLMDQQRRPVSVNSYAALLQGCIKLKSLPKGKQVHSHMIKSSCKINIFLWNTLIDMYAKCGSVLDARQVFESMPKRNVYSWTAIIAAYAREGNGAEAIGLFQQMQQEGLQPDKIVFVFVLKACAILTALKEGKEIHVLLSNQGFGSDIFVASTLVYMYCKCGSLEDAYKVFNKMRERNVVSWNALIAGYAQQGHIEEALMFFVHMQQEGVKPDNVTLVNILKACASPAALQWGKQVHQMMMQRSFKPDIMVGNALIDMYAKCSSIEDARRFFDEMSKRDVVSWTAMMAGYIQQGNCKEALRIFEKMQRECVKPNNITFVTVLKACSDLGDLEEGKKIHFFIMKYGFEVDGLVGSSLIDMYAKCGRIEDACFVFDNMHERDVVSWTSMITGYVQQGYAKEALSLFEEMQEDGMKPDNVTFVSILKACSSLVSLEWGKRVHAHIISNGFESDIVVGNAIIDMYAKCGSMEDAYRVFNKMPVRDIISWNTVATGYAQQGLGKETLLVFEQMQLDGIIPNNVTLTSILKACSTMGALEQAKQVHAYIVGKGFELDNFVCSTLVDMYAKCGSIKDACLVFHKMHARQNVNWNTMISGYAQQGYGEEALALFTQMIQEGINPDEVTCLCVLSACSYSGLIDKGCQLFDSMHQLYGISPTEDHYACVVDLFGRAGQLDDVEEFIKEMPFQPNAVVLMAFFSACQYHGNVVLGKLLFEFVKPEDAKVHLFLSDMYSEAGKWEDKAHVTKDIEGYSV